MKIKVKVNPSSKVKKVEKIDTGSYRVCFKVVPEKGKANKMTIELMAKFLNIPKSNMTVVRGTKSKEKVIKILP